MNEFSVCLVFGFITSNLNKCLSFPQVVPFDSGSLSSSRSSEVLKQEKNKKTNPKMIHIKRPYLTVCFGYKTPGIAATPRLRMNNTQAHAPAPCASMWCCLAGVRAAYLSPGDRLTARAPSTLSTIITSRNTHAHTHRGRSREIEKGRQNCCFNR